MVIDFGITEEELAVSLLYIFRLQLRGWELYPRCDYLHQQTLPRLLSTSMMMVLERTRADDLDFSLITFAQSEGFYVAELSRMMRAFTYRLQPDVKLSVLSRDYHIIVEDLRHRTVPVQQTRERILRWLEGIETMTETATREDTATPDGTEPPESRSVLLL